MLNSEVISTNLLCLSLNKVKPLEQTLRLSSEETTLYKTHICYSFNTFLML